MRDMRNEAFNDAFYEGLAAYVAGKRLDDNPHARGSHRFDAWETGYFHGAEVKRRDGWCSVCGYQHNKEAR